MKLSENFTLQELTKSDTAIRLGIPNEPNSDQIAKLQNLCETLLQPVRDKFGPVIVTSGFRSEQLCVKIGSSINSQHSKAEAVDFEVPGTDNADLAYWIKDNIDGWDHCSIADKPRKQFLRAFKEDGKTKYKPIIGDIRCG
jgi:zinc D-Ala-D-Ala carboxypeptidase